MSFIGNLFGDANEKYIKTLIPARDQAISLGEKFKAYSDSDLREMTNKFKQRLEQGETLDEILPEVFAVVREVADRTLGINPRLAAHAINDTQLLGGIVLHKGQIAEMKTGEGKTRVCVPAAYLNSLLGKGVHVVTVNDYLAKRDALWMGQIYSFLGLSVACLQQFTAFRLLGIEESDGVDDVSGLQVDEDKLEEISRVQAYQADILYGTNSEFGFDYLRDNMVGTLEQMVQRPLAFAIIDEVDSILIDEARTPLIISAPAEESSEKYYTFSRLVKKLAENEDYNVDEKMRAATLTGEGIAKLEKELGVENIYVEGGISTVHHIEQALRAETLFKNDRDYVVKDGEVIIVDEFTGRLMKGRRYSEGLHQAIEAKEGVEVRQESQTLATITIQNYFRMYEKLSGMTGTAATEAEEFSKIYKLDVTVIPTSRQIIRQDLADRIYGTEVGKYKAIIKEVRQRHEKGQPILIGTNSIDKNELLDELLTAEGLVHEMLNAKNHEREAEIIAQAGKVGAITVATNMAGRGVDIILGGNPSTEQEANNVLELGGLCVIGTERHESRRIDNQLRGRSGRLGDPGLTQFYLSMEDDLLRVFGKMDKMKNMMKKMGLPEDMPIENKMVSRSIESAQKKVEGQNFDIRKHVLEYDDVINKHRDVIYKKRKEILEGFEKDQAIVREKVIEMINNEIEQVVNFHTAGERRDDWNLQEIFETMNTIIPVDSNLLDEIKNTCETGTVGVQADVECRTKIIIKLQELALVSYQRLELEIGKSMPSGEEHNPLRDIEKRLLLNSLDSLWVEHLEAMDHMKTGIRLRGYAQKDPLVEYKKEGFRLFNQLLNLIQRQVVYSVFKVGYVKQVEQKSLLNRRGIRLSAPAKTSQSNSDGSSVSSNTSNQKKVGRNDPCTCGSGKKYKKCCGK